MRTLRVFSVVMYAFLIGMSHLVRSHAQTTELTNPPVDTASTQGITDGKLETTHLPVTDTPLTTHVPINVTTVSPWVGRELSIVVTKKKGEKLDRSSLTSRLQKWFQDFCGQEKDSCRPPPASTNRPTIEPTPSVTTPNAPPTESTLNPTVESTLNPTVESTLNPTIESTLNPIEESTLSPTVESTLNPTVESTLNPTVESTLNPTVESTLNPTIESTLNPIEESTLNPTVESTLNPTVESTLNPIEESTLNPTVESTLNPNVTTKEPPQISGYNFNHEKENLIAADNFTFAAVQVLLYEPSSDGESATLGILLLVGDANSPIPIEIDKARDIIVRQRSKIAETLNVEKIDVFSPTTAPNSGDNGWAIAIIVVVIAMLVVLLIGLVIALRRNRRSTGDGSQYMGQRALSQSFDNAAYNQSTQSVRIGSFDKP